MAAKRKPGKTARARAPKPSNPKSKISNLKSEILTALLTGRSEALMLAPRVLHDCDDNRRHIDPKDPENLALVESVRSAGVCDPLTVRPLAGKPGQYEVRDGKRRLWAARQAGLEAVPCICWHDMTDDAAGDLTAVLNCLRKDLGPFEDAETVRDMLGRHGGDVDAVAKILARPRHWVVARERLRELSPAWRAAWADRNSILSRWTVRHMELIARLDPAGQDAALSAHRGEHAWVEFTSTRELQQWIDENLLHRVRAAPFSRADATLVPAAGACDACPKRTSAHGRLWVEDDDLDAVPAKDDACMDPACWAAKRAAWMAARRSELTAAHPGLLLVVDQYALGGDHLKALAAEHGAPVLALGQYDRASGPKARGAVAALCVDGSSAGELLWIKRTDGKGGPGARGSAAPGGGNGGKPAGAPLVERRAALDSKRWFEVLKLARHNIKAMLVSDLPEPLRTEHGILSLACAFGTHHRNDTAGKTVTYHPRMRRIDPHALMPGYLALVPGTMGPASEIWPSIRAVLAKRLSYNGPLTQVPAKFIAECRALCSLLNLPLDDLRAKAAAVYKEPQSWRSLPGYTPEAGVAPAPPAEAHAPGARIGLCAEIPDGADLFILAQSGGTFGLYRADPGAVPERLDKRDYPDRPTLADAEEDLREYAQLCGFTLLPAAADTAAPAKPPKKTRRGK